MGWLNPPTGSGRIEIRALRLVATHGALDEERTRAQPFELDIDLVLDATDAGASDRLTDTVDYGAVVERAAHVVRSTSFLLLEALADAVARGILDLDRRVEQVAVSVRKLRPPIPEDLGSVGVKVCRVRPGDGAGPG
ncbi:MAG: dihydroneopterin aldolase [Acidimicrobiales bacterium]